MRVFWDSVIATSSEDDVLMVTTITKRGFPLINYRTDDVVRVTEEIDGSILGMQSVVGRKRDVLRMALTDGTEVNVNGAAAHARREGIPARLLHSVRAEGRRSWKT
ncbi:MAG: hypothetical protein IH968_03845 [Gemmatimonadetes bacterium]|nr:hypothetical protein [Gemmatimonadota bacterium]